MSKRKAPSEDLYDFCVRLHSGCNVKVRLNTHELQIQKTGDDEKCGLYISSIYFHLSVDLDDRTSNLDKFNKPVGHKNVTDEALGLVDLLNIELKIQRCTLTDQSTFLISDRSSMPVNARSIRRTLSLLRGYSLYNKRGWMDYDIDETQPQLNMDEANKKLNILFHKICGKEYFQLIQDIINPHNKLSDQYEGKYEMQEVGIVDFNLLEKNWDKSFVTKQSMKQKINNITDFLTYAEDVYGIYIPESKKTFTKHEIIEKLLSGRLKFKLLQIASDTYLKLSGLSEPGIKTFFLMENNPSLENLLTLIESVKSIVLSDKDSLFSYFQYDDVKNLGSISEVASHIITHYDEPATQKNQYDLIYDKLLQLAGVKDMGKPVQCKFYKYSGNNQVLATNLTVSDCEKEIPPKFLFVRLETEKVKADVVFLANMNNPFDQVYTHDENEW